MRNIRVLLALLAAWLPATAQAACVTDQRGDLICGEGKDAVVVFPDTTSPSKRFAFGWRTPTGLPSGQDIPSGVEDVLIRLDDGAVLTTLGGAYWASHGGYTNRYEQVAAWSPDNRAVVEVANSRWDSDSFTYYAIDGNNVTKIDLRALVEPVLKANLPADRRTQYSFRVQAELPVTLDTKGHVRCTVEIFVPKMDPIGNYAVTVAIRSKGGKPDARIASVRRVKVDPRL